VKAADQAAPGAEQRVVVNAEGQYSIWPRDRPLPRGWADEGTVGTQEACSARIEEIWTDMCPQSVRGSRS
jgi:MbtH protein